MGDLQIEAPKTLQPPILLNKTNTIKNSGHHALVFNYKGGATQDSIPKPLIGEFKQGFLSDCWLCAIAKSLSLDPEGNKQLSKMIKKEGNSYTVTFTNDVQFKVSDKEISDEKVRFRDGTPAQKPSMIYFITEFPFVKLKHNPYVTYSTGDKNLRILEIAANKYIHKLATENEKKGLLNKEYASKTCLENYTISENLLFGDLSQYTSNCIDLKKIKASDIAMVGTNSDSAFNNLMNNGISHHAYSVKAIDKHNNIITLINPHNTKDEPLCLSFDDFYKRFSMVTLKGKYKDTITLTNIRQNIDNSAFIKKTIQIAEKQEPKELSQAYASAGPKLLGEAGEKKLKAKFIANLIEYSSKGAGTYDNSFKGAIYSIDSKEMYYLVDKYLKSIPNREYTSKDKKESMIDKYIEEEFSFTDNASLLKYTAKFK